MAIGLGFSLLILAGVAAGLAMAVFNLQEWAWSASMATIGVGTVLTVISLFALRRYVLIPVGPSLACHLFVVATAIWMLAYLSRPRVKQAFSASNA
jgi:preprotein translocase subunit SecY